MSSAFFADASDFSLSMWEFFAGAAHFASRAASAG
jgi:hypothetical protein